MPEPKFDPTPASEIERRQFELLTPEQRERLSRVGGRLTAFEIAMASSLEEALENREASWESARRTKARRSSSSPTGGASSR